MAQEDVAPIRVGLLGAGTVGSQTARLLVEQKDELAARIGRPIELTGVACLDPAETDPFPWIDKAIVTTDTMSVATNSDIVIELIGGTGVARKFVLAAIESGASVVTANKALLAKYGPEIYSAAEAKGVALAHQMVELLHGLDKGRPVTAGINLMIIDRASRGQGIYANDGSGVQAQKKKKPKDGQQEEKVQNASLMFNIMASLIGSGMNKAANSKHADAVTAPVLDALDLAGYNYASGRYEKAVSYTHLRAHET